MGAAEIAEKAIKIAASIDIYSSGNATILSVSARDNDKTDKDKT